MNPKIKSKWVAALRSGKFKQGRGRLKPGDSYCCLGVLCELYSQESSDYKVWKPNGVSLPSEVVEWAELESGNPFVAGKTLTYLNDVGRWDFGTIADLIERYL